MLVMFRFPTLLVCGVGRCLLRVPRPSLGTCGVAEHESRVIAFLLQHNLQHIAGHRSSEPNVIAGLEGVQDELRAFRRSDFELTFFICRHDRAVVAKDFRSRDWLAIDINHDASNVRLVVLLHDLTAGSRLFEPFGITQRLWRRVLEDQLQRLGRLRASVARHFDIGSSAASIFRAGIEVGSTGHEPEFELALVVSGDALHGRA